MPVSEIEAKKIQKKFNWKLKRSVYDRESVAAMATNFLILPQAALVIRNWCSAFNMPINLTHRIQSQSLVLASVRTEAK